MDEQFVTALGPLSSDWGNKTWSFFFASDRIIACPYHFSETIRLGLRLYFHFWPADPGEELRSRAATGLTEPELPRDRRFRRYHAHLLKRIIMRSNATANTITVVKLSGEEDVYSLPLRDQTDSYREVLSVLYPAIYLEQGFPTTALGRLLKG